MFTIAIRSVLQLFGPIILDLHMRRNISQLCLGIPDAVILTEANTLDQVLAILIHIAVFMNFEDVPLVKSSGLFTSSEIIPILGDQVRNPALHEGLLFNDDVSIGPLNLEIHSESLVV
jgi:hypothetical protein